MQSFFLRVNLGIGQKKGLIIYNCYFGLTLLKKSWTDFYGDFCQKTELLQKKIRSFQYFNKKNHRSQVPILGIFAEIQ